MIITQDLLTINPYSRSGKPITAVKAIVVHWTANPNVSAKNNKNYFESRKNGLLGYGAAQYIVGLQGEIIQCIPDTEMAFHCGSSQVDPASKVIYTDLARKKFGKYANLERFTDSTQVLLSPNQVTIGIEICPIDADGNFSKVTLDSVIELTASLLKKFSLTVDDILTHNQIVGWKNCPKLFVDHPEKFEEFKQNVAKYNS